MRSSNRREPLIATCVILLLAGCNAASGSGGGGGGAGGGAGGATTDAAMETGAGQDGAPDSADLGAGGTVRSPCPVNGDPCKIMPFGDSITDGFGVGGGYRVELFRRAHQAGRNITFVGSMSNGPGQVDGAAFPPNHEGHSGYTIAPIGGRSGISPLVATVMPQFKPHIVLLMIGTNDAIDNADLLNAPARLGALIDSIYSNLPEALIIVAQPIPSQDDALNGRIQTYNAAIPAVVQSRLAAGKNIALVDMYPVIASHADYKTALLQDTWHPNAAGHALLGAAWYDVVAPALP